MLSMARDFSSTPLVLFEDLYDTPIPVSLLLPAFRPGRESRRSQLLSHLPPAFLVQLYRRVPPWILGVVAVLLANWLVMRHAAF